MLSFPTIEEKILKFWQEKNIFKKTLAKDSPSPRGEAGKGPFNFYEGPPTANGMPGLHHVLARVFKDLIPRFKTMQGYHVERKAGWDTHGLPVELEVEKKLKISGKPEIEKFGIEKFNNECKKSVWKYKEDWEKLTERIAFWLDMEHPYVTYDKNYVESLWWIFKEIHKRGLLYQGHKVVPQCPRCGTALSSHEVAQGYESVTEPSVYLKFKVTKGKGIVKAGDYILSWTTTPWTLPGNVALAVGNDFQYVKVKINANESVSAVAGTRRGAFVQRSCFNETYIIAKERLNIIDGDYQTESEFKGKDLIGVEYEPLFPGAIPSDVEDYNNAFKVYEADFVTTEDGTGIVHTAVMYGEDDYNLGTEVGLPKYHTVNENGRFYLNEGMRRGAFVLKNLYQSINGKFVKDKAVEQAIVDNLKERHLLFKTEDYTHDYPFCWRCESPLLYYAKDSWFFKMSDLRKELIKENQKINWVPEHIKDGRFGEWLSNVKDWAISRERYWGTPLPIWKCDKCEEIKVIGSYKELHKETECPLILQDDYDPHRPFIDEYKLKCKCGSQMSRVPEVADCWFDSGAMPFAQHHYPFENKEKVDSKDYYPADFIAEAIDQTRGWFYTLLAIGVLVERGTSYKNVICLGHINDKHGHKMSKSKGNVVDPWEVINKWGADALRFHLCTVNQPGESKNFDIKNVESVVKRNFMILFNVLSFYQMYVGESKIKNRRSKIKDQNVLDRWVLARLNQLIDEVTKNLDNYNIFTAGRSLTKFIDDLSTWYLRRSRDRFKGENQEDKELAVSTLGYCLLTLSKIMAPFTPMVAEELYQNIGGEKESVHLEEWPRSETRNAKRETRILVDMEQVRKIVELALAKRDEAGIKVRQPLGQLSVTGSREFAFADDELTLSVTGSRESAFADDELTLSVTGSRESAFADDELTQLIKDEVNVKEVTFKEGKTLSVKINTELSDELKEEGMYRELVRTVNQLRKEAKLTIKDQVEVNYQTDSALVKKAIKKFQKELLKNTISKKLIEQKSGDNLIEKEVKVNEEKIWLCLR